MVAGQKRLAVAAESVVAAVRMVARQKLRAAEPACHPLQAILLVPKASQHTLPTPRSPVGPRPIQLDVEHALLDAADFLRRAFYDHTSDPRICLIKCMAEQLLTKESG